MGETGVITQALSAEQLVAAAARSQAYSSSGNEFYQFLKTRLKEGTTPAEGEIVFGSDSIPVHPESRWVADMMGLQQGFLRRRGVQVVEEVLVPWTEGLGPPPIAAPGETVKAAFSGRLVCTTGEHPGVRVKLSGDSFAINKFWGDLRDLFTAGAQAAEQAGSPILRYPLLKLWGEPWYSKRFGKWFARPRFEVDKWLGDNDAAALLDSSKDTPYLPPAAEEPVTQPRTRSTVSFG